MRGKPGRVSKGDRRPVMVRFPSDQVERYQLEADRHDLPLSDWIIEQVAKAQGVDPPEYLEQERERIRDLKRRKREADVHPNQGSWPIPA